MIEEPFSGNHLSNQKQQKEHNSNPNSRKHHRIVHSQRFSPSQNIQDLIHFPFLSHLQFKDLLLIVLIVIFDYISQSKITICEGLSVVD